MAAMPSTSAAPGPLSGLRVIDCSTVLAGPYCTMVLGDLGADIIKVEPPEGDATRRWGPPWVGSVEDGTRTAAYYLAVNRNKRSVTIDLAKPEGQALVRRLAAQSDVVVENYKVGQLARYGLDHASLAAVKANLARLQEVQGYRLVKAPFDGVITLRNVDVGALVSTGSTLLYRIAQVGTLRTYVNVPQVSVNSVHVGQAATFSRIEFRDEMFAV